MLKYVFRSVKVSGFEKTMTRALSHIAQWPIRPNHSVGLRGNRRHKSQQRWPGRLMHEAMMHTFFYTAHLEF